MILLSNEGISVVDCIIDAEGSDFEVIRGARRTIERAQTRRYIGTDHLGRFGSSKLDVSSFFSRLIILFRKSNATIQLIYSACP